MVNKIHTLSTRSLFFLQQIHINLTLYSPGARYFSPESRLSPDLHLIKAIQPFIYVFFPRLNASMCKLLEAIIIRVNRDNLHFGAPASGSLSYNGRQTWKLEKETGSKRWNEVIHDRQKPAL